MTEDRMPLPELLQKAGDGDFLRAVGGSVLVVFLSSTRCKRVLCLCYC